ncbi:MAG: antitoxin [Nocardioidaceae bacterium]
MDKLKGNSDKVEEKAGDLASEHSDKVDEGLEKGDDVVDDKTGGKFDEQTDKGVDAAKDRIDDLGNE